MSFADYKKNRHKHFETLTQEVEKLDQNQNNYNDERVWYPKRDKDGNGYAIIRFLPCIASETAPFVRYWHHSFKGPSGQWYIEKSRTTFGEADPVSEYNTELWNTGVKANKDKASDQKRKLTYVSNIYVIEDPATPENQGKVFLFQYGKKIFDMLKDKMHPAFKDETPLDPFDMFEGANFKLKIRQVEDWPNYDKSEFMEKKPLFTDDAKMEEVYNKLYPLSEFVDPKKFKSYEELKKRLHTVLKLGGTDSAKTDEVKEQVKEAPKEKERPAPSQPEAAPQEVTPDGDDEDIAFFKQLAED